ncbi:MAG: hypothetical protein FWC06_03395 [Treponema sp.]|nr:hypothetical protein [Treponema sp.]
MADNESEWKDVDPKIENLPNRGRSIILFVAGGIALAILTIVGMRIRPVGLVIGVFTFMSGLTMLVRRRKFNYRPGIIVTVCGFFLLLANPRFGLVAGFAGFFLIIGAVGLVVFGLFRAIKLAWELGRFS